MEEARLQHDGSEVGWAQHDKRVSDLIQTFLPDGSSLLNAIVSSSEPRLVTALT